MDGIRDSWSDVMFFWALCVSDVSSASMALVPLRWRMTLERDRFEESLVECFLFVWGWDLAYWQPRLRWAVRLVNSCEQWGQSSMVVRGGCGESSRGMSPEMGRRVWGGSEMGGWKKMTGWGVVVEWQNNMYLSDMWWEYFAVLDDIRLITRVLRSIIVEVKGSEQICLIYRNPY